MKCNSKTEQKSKTYTWGPVAVSARDPKAAEEQRRIMLGGLCSSTANVAGGR